MDDGKTVLHPQEWAFKESIRQPCYKYRGCSNNAIDEDCCDNCWELQVGSPVKRYIIRSAQAVSGTYNTGMAAARNNAQVELATMLQTRIAAAMESKLDNSQTSSITANTVEKFHERAKSIVDACLTNTNIVLSIYRVTAQNNYEVQVQVCYDKKELAARIKRAMQKELEKEGDEDLNHIVDGVLSGEF